VDGIAAEFRSYLQYVHLFMAAGGRYVVMNHQTRQVKFEIDTGSEKTSSMGEMSVSSIRVDDHSTKEIYSILTVREISMSASSMRFLRQEADRGNARTRYDSVTSLSRAARGRCGWIEAAKTIQTCCWSRTSGRSIS
jgi:hypothetical protein